MTKPKKPPSLADGSVVHVPPPAYTAWRTEPFSRDEDAAHTFGYYLITKCRDEALKKLPAGSPPRMRAAIEEAVDVALHNVMDLLEGYWPLHAGEDHQIELALQMRVMDKNRDLVDTRELSPCKLDLPIGYWIWAKEREFQRPSVGEALRAERAAKPLSARGPARARARAARASRRPKRRRSS